MLNFRKISKLQKENGFDKIQESINNGSVWHKEGSSGREAMRLLKIGVVMLPKAENVDHYGGTIPSRDSLKKGTCGTFQNCKNFWSDINNLDYVYGL